jgi:hypothetical protein
MTLRRQILGLLGFSLIAVGAPGPAAAPARPLHLLAEPASGGTRLKVVGHSATACVATYVLEVSSGSNGGRNHSVQRGAARLQPGVPTTVATLTLAVADPSAWSARLSVEPCGAGRAYEERGGSQR